MWGRPEPETEPVVVSVDVLAVKNQIDCLREKKAGGLSPAQAAQLKELLTGLLKEHPTSRMTIRQALEHPFLREDDAPNQAA